MTLRMSDDPRIVVTDADCAAIERGDDVTPTDIALIFAGAHPYFACCAEVQL